MNLFGKIWLPCHDHNKIMTKRGHNHAMMSAAFLGRDSMIHVMIMVFNNVFFLDVLSNFSRIVAAICHLTVLRNLRLPTAKSAKLNEE